MTSGKRLAGVTATVILLTLGGILCLGVTTLMVFALAYASASSAPPLTGPDMERLARIGMFTAIGLFALVAFWQVVTAIGLWRLKPWSRTSVLIFSGMMVAFQGMGIFFLFVMLPPADAGSGGVITAIRIFLIAFYVIPIVLGVWWLIYFTRASVKAQFSGGLVPPESPQPLSIVLIGWYLLSGALMWPVFLVWQWPAIFLWKVVMGWPALLVSSLWCVAMLYAGVGLLRWKKSAYEVARWIFILGGLNALVFWLTPGASARMQEIIEHTHFPMVEGFTPKLEPLDLWLSLALSLLSVAIPLWFLHTRKERFLAMAARAASLRQPQG